MWISLTIPCVYAAYNTLVKFHGWINTMGGWISWVDTTYYTMGKFHGWMNTMGRCHFPFRSYRVDKSKVGSRGVAALLLQYWCSPLFGVVSGEASEYSVITASSIFYCNILLIVYFSKSRLVISFPFKFCISLLSFSILQISF